MLKETSLRNNVFKKRRESWSW